MRRVVWGVVLGALYVFLLAPILITVPISFESASFITFPPPGWSLKWYVALVHNTDFIHGFRISVIVAVIVAAVAVTISLPVALAVTRHNFRGRDLVSGLFLSPLMVPAVVLGLGLLLILNPIGLTGTYLGLVIAHLGITVPYTVRTVASALLSCDSASEEAARTLGATKFVTFLRVTFPAILPGVIAGAAIAFLVSFDEAVISLFVVSGNFNTLPVVIFRYVQSRTDPQIAALSVILVIISILFVVVIERALGLKRTLER